MKLGRFSATSALCLSVGTWWAGCGCTDLPCNAKLIIQTPFSANTVELIDEESDSGPYECVKGSSCWSTEDGEQVVVFYIDPERATVRLRASNGEVLHEETVMPEYEREYPNGKECGGCGQGSVVVGM